MDTESMRMSPPRALLALLVLLAAALVACGPSAAQTPVDENGEPLAPIDEAATDEAADPTAGIEAEGADPENLAAEELEELVAPIALYPDDLLAIVLPASAYPLQIVQAARFLEELENDKSLKPDESWDPSVTALLNYPEVVKLMNDDLDWTYELGEAVVRQQADVIAAVEAFRDRAYAAGNLKSDERQTVSNNNGVIEIEPAEEDVIYVPYYEPERVVVYQTEPVYHYYARPCPVYYYPYPYGYSFGSGYFWGVTTAFTIGWTSHHLHVFHDSYFGHPYYGRPYYYGYFYRRPSINVYNTFYVDNHVRRPPHYRRDGDFWRPDRHGGALPGNDRYRADYYRDTRRARTADGYRDQRDVWRSRQVSAGSSRQTDRSAGLRGEAGSVPPARPGTDDRDVRFARNRPAADARGDRPDAAGQRRADEAGASDNPIRFRERERAADARRSAGDEQPIRFRAREQLARPAAPAAADPVVRARLAERTDRTPGSSSSRSQGSIAVPSMRVPRATSRPEVSSRASGPGITARPATPSHTSAPSLARPAPQSAAPRASAPSMSRPAPVSRPAPASPSRAAPRPPSTPDSGSRRHHGNRH